MKPVKSELIILFAAVLALIAPICFAGDSEDYRICPGDTLEISVWGQPDLGRKIDVSPHGEFTFPPLGQVRAAGLTAFELEKRLQDKLTGRFLVNPQVSVAVLVSINRKIFILGEVRNPGTYQLKGRTTLSQLVAEAGGLTDNAARAATLIRSPVTDTPQSQPATATTTTKTNLTVNLQDFTSKNSGGQFVLTAGDTVYIPEAPKFYVVGEVRRPGEFKWEDGITVRRALSMAGGPTEKAAPGRTEIVRSADNGAERTLQPDMNDAVDGGDIVKVPLSYF